MNEFVVEPNIEFWKDIGINPEKVLEKEEKKDIIKALESFKNKGLKLFFDEMGLSSGKFTTEGIIKHLLRRHIKHANTLYLIKAYSGIVEKTSLISCARKLEISFTTNDSKAILSLRIFLKDPSYLKIIRLKGISVRLQKFIHFSTNKDIVGDLRTSEVKTKLASLIKAELTYGDRKAKLEGVHYDSESESYLVSIKHEDTKRKVEEMEGSHWDDPVKWIMLTYSPKDKSIVLKGKDEKRGKKAVEICSEILTGNDTGFEQTKLDKFMPKAIKVFDPSKLAGYKNEELEILKWDLKEIKLENVRIQNTPNIQISGNNLFDTLETVKKKYKLDLVDGSEIRRTKMKVLYEYKGVKNEITLSLSNGLLSSSSSLPALLENKFIDFIKEQFGDKVEFSS